MKSTFLLSNVLLLSEQNKKFNDKICKTLLSITKVLPAMVGFGKKRILKCLCDLARELNLIT